VRSVLERVNTRRSGKDLNDDRAAPLVTVPETVRSQPVRRPTLAVLALPLVLAPIACAQEAKDAELGSVRTDDPVAQDGADNSPDAEQGSIAWESCGANECAEIEVPVDYDDPDGDTLTLSVLRVPASGDRIGALFVNPGGPGGTATDFAEYVGFSFPSELTDRFDIVGVDPRGLGASEIDCGADFTELYGQDYSIDSEDDEQALLEVSQDYVDDCEAAVGTDLLANLGTLDVARDMDAVRAAMGEDQINYLGFSYGTAIGQVYAEEFPDRLRAMVLDGLVDLELSGTELAEEQALGFESALEAFAADCDDQGSSGCPIAPDALDAIDELSQRVEEAPVVAEPRDLGPGELAIGLSQPLYAPFLWPDLADAIAEALDGDGTAMVALADDYLSFGSFDIYFAVNCLDLAWPDRPEELLAEGAGMENEAPHFGPSIVNDYVRCTMWPIDPEPLPAISAPDAPPIVVVSTTNDPATPYEFGVRTAERLETGVLVTYEGEGHGAISTGSSCVDDLVVDYLVDLEPPEDGTTCT
jgi:pimeloyl-ACP methyl ester carboxylesterase